ncbi:unnamed protein product, partial [Urochloa humidicola]
MSRQARKEAAASARDLLKFDAAQVRKAGAVPRRKGGAAAMRKAAVAPVPTAAAATPPRSFSDGTNLFNSGSDDFFSGPVQITQPWNQQSS